jgi:transposase
MRAMTRSPLRLAKVALAVGKSALPVYSGRFSRKDFTQPQLFAVLVVRKYLKIDYRSMTAWLYEWSDLRALLSLKKVPHYSTLCYAETRLMGDGTFPKLLKSVIGRAKRKGLIGKKPEAAIDATGLETRHTSAHYVKRTGYKRFLRHSWPKLTAVCDTKSHLIVGAVTGTGPSQDSPYLPPAVRQAAANIRPHRLLADKAYDAEHNHVLCRELGVRSLAIPINRRRGGRKWPKTKYRRQMKRRFPKLKYRQRVQAESVFSRHKRRLGSALTAKNDPSQDREMLARVLTHDLMILRRCD